MKELLTVKSNFVIICSYSWNLTSSSQKLNKFKNNQYINEGAKNVFKII